MRFHGPVIFANCCDFGFVLRRVVADIHDAEIEGYITMCISRGIGRDPRSGSPEMLEPRIYSTAIRKLDDDLYNFGCELFKEAGLEVILFAMA